TCNDQRLRVFPNQHSCQLYAVALHGFRTFRAVRNTGRVAKVDNVFVWQQIAQRLHYSKAADTRIENADWARITHAARKLIAVATCCNCLSPRPFKGEGGVRVDAKL